MKFNIKYINKIIRKEVQTMKKVLKSKRQYRKNNEILAYGTYEGGCYTSGCYTTSCKTNPC
jgi:hypothetical protein